MTIMTQLRPTSSMLLLSVGIAGCVTDGEEGAELYADETGQQSTGDDAAPEQANEQASPNPAEGAELTVHQEQASGFVNCPFSGTVYTAPPPAPNAPLPADLLLYPQLSPTVAVQMAQLSPPYTQALPDPGPGNTAIIRYATAITVPVTGKYGFYFGGPVRRQLWIDGVKVSAQAQMVITLGAGPHTIMVDTWEVGSDFTVDLKWDPGSPNGTPSAANAVPLASSLPSEHPRCLLSIPGDGTQVHSAKGNFTVGTKVQHPWMYLTDEEAMAQETHGLAVALWFRTRPLVNNEVRSLFQLENSSIYMRKEGLCGLGACKDRFDDYEWHLFNLIVDNRGLDQDEDDWGDADVFIYVDGVLVRAAYKGTPYGWFDFWWGDAGYLSVGNSEVEISEFVLWNQPTYVGLPQSPNGPTGLPMVPWYGQYTPGSYGAEVYWRFDEGAGGTVNDYSANNFDGTASATPLWFYWNDPNAAAPPPPPPPPPPPATDFTDPALWVQHGGGYEPGQAQYADFDGDGKIDLAMRGLDNSIYVSLSTGSGFTGPELWVQHGGPYDADQAHYADVNGDGRADLSFRGTDNSIWVSLSTGTDFLDPEHWVQHGGSYVHGQAQYADVNGDGKADLIMRGLDNSIYVSLSTGTDFLDPEHWVQHGGQYEHDQAHYADFNGDGKADLSMRGLDNSIYVSLSTGTDFTDPELWVQHGGAYDHEQAQYADFNGDGKADLAMRGLDNSIYVSLSTGTDFTDPALWVQHGGPYAHGQAKYADITGDGMADLAMRGLDNGIWVSLSTGADLTDPALWVQHGGAYDHDQAHYGDVNGDGMADLIMRGLDNSIWVSIAE